MTMVATYTTINTHVRILFPFPILFIIAPSECLDSHSMLFFHSVLFIAQVFHFHFQFFFFCFCFFDIVLFRLMRLEYISNSQLQRAYWTSIYIGINNQTIQIDCSCCCFWNMLSTFSSSFPPFIRYSLLLLFIDNSFSFDFNRNFKMCFLFWFGQPTQTAHCNVFHFP